MTKYRRLNKREFLDRWFLKEIVYDRKNKKWVAIRREGGIWFEGSFEEMLDMLDFKYASDGVI